MKLDGREFLHRMPPSSIHRMAATQDGTLWLVTPGGLVHSDGTNFTAITHTKTNGICNNPTVGPDESIWFGSDQGLWRYDPSPESGSP